jgi:GDP/UDP-N,N'-diacetylbacillosamine 2-epimerase (hydrolysing)
VFCTGTHLVRAFGHTVEQVRRDAAEVVEVPLFCADRPTDATAVTAGDVGAMSVHLAEALAAHPVDIMVVLGDRIETLAAAVTVIADECVLAHIHGGDRAPGQFDDASRHAITKLAHLHFPVTDASAERIRRMGEPADRVHMVGSPGIDSILAEPPVSTAKARADAGIGDAPYVVLLYHPSNLDDVDADAALEKICQGIVDAGLKAICIEPNPDPGREAVVTAIRKFSSRLNWPISATVGRRIFLRLIHDAVALVGNSSAGMIESAAVDAVVVNVGDRQRGREHSGNVVHVAVDRTAIAETLGRLQTDHRWCDELRAAPCVFGDGRASGRIADVLAHVELSGANRTKLNEY